MGRRHSSTSPFLDIEVDAASFSIPRLKWRELVFIGALVPDGEYYVRDPSRPLPAFRLPDLFPERVLFRVEVEGETVHIQRVDRAQSRPR